MGWLYTNKPAGMSMRDFFSERFDHENGKVLDVAMVGWTEAYIAYEVTNNDGTKNVIGIACLINFCPNDPYCNFGYKAMEETMGPSISNCPRRILEKLTPTTHKWAIEWRERCWQKVRQREAKRGLLKDGDLIRFAHPISFTNGYAGDTFRVEKKRNKVRFRPPSSFTLYRIKNWQYLDFEILERRQPVD